MDTPGGRPTPGLEHALTLLAGGGDDAQVIREALRAAASAAGASQAVAIAQRGSSQAEVAAYGVPSDCLRATASAAAAQASPAAKSDPLQGLNAGAVPVVFRGRVLGALAVAGPAATLDPTPLDTAAAIVGLVLDQAATVAAGVRLASAAPLAEVRDPADLGEAVMATLAEAAPLPAFVCLPEGGRLRVAKYRGIERDRLSALVGAPEFLEMVRAWRERPAGAEASHRLDLNALGATIVCAPVLGGAGIGLVGLVVDSSQAPEASRLLDDLAPHVSAARARSEAEHGSRRRDHEIDMLVQANPLPMVVFDADGNFLRTNGAAGEALGLSGGFDAGRPARGRIGDLELERLLFDETRPGEMEVQIGTPPRAHRAVVTRIYDGDEHVRSVLTLEDVSTHRARNQLQEDFVAMIGHELRTPLTVAKGFLETVLSRGDNLEAEQRDEFLTTSLRQTERLEELINDLLFLSTERPRAGLHHEEVDVLAVASRLGDRYESRFPGRTIDCLPMGPTTAFVDQRYLAQALRHLLDNALKYSEGSVTVEVGGAGSTLTVAVVDQGPGIFSGDVERLFEPFEQKDSSSTRAHGGTGLGLYVTRRLVEALGGRLDCDSRLGQGSRFSFQVPRNPADSNGESPRVGAVRDDAGA